MYMSTPIVRGKRRAIVETLSRRIREGTYEPGDRLEGELRFAEEFGVSRGTVRQALAELQDRRLIATEPGRGSFVIFDGHPLDQARGWAQSLAESGSEVTAEVLSIEGVDPAEVPLLPGEVELGPAIAVRRIRSLGADGTARRISFECAPEPAPAPLADLPATGLADGSLSTSLARAGLVAARGTQRADVHALDAREAALLHRDEGTAFLRTSRTSFTSTGRFVEHVVSLLDPAHFTLALTFGDDA
jgi:GntR family transcriptional regulator